MLFANSSRALAHASHGVCQAYRITSCRGLPALQARVVNQAARHACTQRDAGRLLCSSVRTLGLPEAVVKSRTLTGHQIQRHTCCAIVNASATDGKIRYLYDGGCKVCQTFKSSLEAQEGNKDRIDYVNIAEDSFNPKEHNNVSYDDAMSTIHAISADGKTVKGPDAVKELFGEAGSATDFIAKAADQPGFDSLFGGAYDFMSKNRFAISDAATKAKKAVGAE